MFLMIFLYLKRSNRTLRIDRKRLLLLNENRVYLAWIICLGFSLALSLFWGKYQLPVYALAGNQVETEQTFLQMYIVQSVIEEKGVTLKTSSNMPIMPLPDLTFAFTLPFTTPVPEGGQNPELQPPPETDPDAGVVINEVKLIDTIFQWFAWGWMCLGVGFILLILLIFPFLQIRGSHLKRREQEE